MPEITFLTLAEVIQIHNDQIKRYGGIDGIQDIGLLVSALSMPEASVGGKLLHVDIVEMAVAYAYYIYQNHPFVDGNKRTALASALVFLELNNISLIAPEEQLYTAMMDVASGKLDKRGLSEILHSLPQEK